MREQMPRHVLRAARRAPALAAMIAMAAGCAMLQRHAPPVRPVELWGFTAPWDPRSAASVAAHGACLDVIVSGWITLDSASFLPVTPFHDTLSRDDPGSPARHAAIVTSYQGDRFHPETVRALASDSLALAKTASALARTAAGYGSLVLDLEGMTPGDLDALMTVVRAFRDSVHVHGIAPLTLAIPALDTAAYPARPLATVADLLAVMLYDEHWLTSSPGPVATPSWAARALRVRAGEVGAARLVASIPVYGYRWRTDSAAAVISYGDAVRLAALGGVALARDPVSSTLHAATRRWELWVSDAVLADTLARAVRAAGVRRIALWRLGLEDPALWAGGAGQTRMSWSCGRRGVTSTDASRTTAFTSLRIPTTPGR